MEEIRELVEITGVLDVSTELCIDGTEALSLMTDEGDDYVINNRKTVKRLMDYAYSGSRLICKGRVVHDPTGIDVLSVISFVEVNEDGTSVSTSKKEAKPSENDEKPKAPKGRRTTRKSAAPKKKKLFDDDLYSDTDDSVEIVDIDEIDDEELSSDY